MALDKILKDTFKEWKRNTWFILLFSLMFLVSLISLFLAPTPTYVSLGGAFMRIGSIPEMNLADLAIVIAAYLFSLFIFADGITNINLLIKANRTLNKIPTEVFSGIFDYALKIFFVYTIAVLLSFMVNAYTFDNQLHNVISPLFTMLIFIAIVFVPPAIVVDEMDTFRAISTSISMLRQKWLAVLLWMVGGLAAISIIELILFLLVPLAIAKYLVVAINALVIIPMLTILQTQIYLEKYPLSP